MEDLDRLNFELTEAYANLCTKQAQLEVAIEGLSKIKDSYDPYSIADKCLSEIDYLGQK